MVNHHASIFFKGVDGYCNDIFLVFEGGVVMVSYEVNVGDDINKEKFRDIVDGLPFKMSPRNPEWVASNTHFWGATITSVQPRI